MRYRVLFAVREAADEEEADAGQNDASHGEVVARFGVPVEGRLDVDVGRNADEERQGFGGLNEAPSPGKVPDPDLLEDEDG